MIFKENHGGKSERQKKQAGISLFKMLASWWR